MPTVSEYREKLNRATLADDKPAIAYFQSQIAKGEAMPMPGQKPVPQGGSIMDPIAQGVSMGFADEIGGGVSGLYNVITGDEAGFSGGYTKTRDEMRNKADEYAQRHPYVSLGAELISGAALPLGMARTAAQGIRLGAGAGALTGAGKAEEMENVPHDALVGGALGGAAGGAASAAGGLFRTLVPARAQRATTPGHAADIGRLEAAGMPVSPAERLASPGARSAEKQAAAYFGAGDDLAARPAQIRSHIMARGGFTADDVAAGDLSHDALRRASQHFNNEYDNVLRNTTVDLRDMDPALAAVEQRFYGQMLDHEQKAEVRRVLDSFRDEMARNQVVDAAGNVSTPIRGLDYKRIRSNLGKTARMKSRQSGEGASLAPLYRDIQTTLDDAFRANARPGVAQRLGDIDRQYRHYAFLREVSENPDNINAIAGRVMSSNVDDDLKAIVKAYQNVVVRGAKGEGTAEASGQLMPPVMSMAKAAGARIAAGRPQLPAPVDAMLGSIPPGTATGAFGQAAGMFGPEDTHNASQKRSRAARRAKSKQRKRDSGTNYVRPDDTDHEYR